MRRIICIPAAAPDTSAMRRHVRTYDIHVHIHDCACGVHLHSHLGRDAPPSATQIMRAALQQRRKAPHIPRCCLDSGIARLTSRNLTSPTLSGRVPSQHILTRNSNLSLSHDGARPASRLLMQRGCSADARWSERNILYRWFS